MLTIGEVFRELARGDRFYEKLLVMSIGKKWVEIVGKPVAERSWIDDFSNGVLYIVTDDPVWHEELTFMSRHIVDRVNQLLGETFVNKIVIRRVKRWKNTTPRV